MTVIIPILRVSIHLDPTNAFATVGTLAMEKVARKHACIHVKMDFALLTLSANATWDGLGLTALWTAAAIIIHIVKMENVINAWTTPLEIIVNTVWKLLTEMLHCLKSDARNASAMVSTRYVCLGHIIF